MQISLRFRAVWSESSLGTVKISKDAKFLHHTKKTLSNQIAGMRRPISVFDARTSEDTFFTLWLKCVSDQVEFKISPADAYADEAKLVVDSVIEMAIKRLETSLSKSDKEITFESRRRSEMSRDSTIARDENYTLEDISWVSVGDFSVRRAERTLKEFIQVTYKLCFHIRDINWVFPRIMLVGPRHAETCLRAYADSKGPDQPARLRRLVRTFAVHKQNLWIL